MNFLEQARARLKEILEQRDAKKGELDTFAGTLDTEERSATPDEDILVDLAVDEISRLNDEAEAAQSRVEELERAEAIQNDSTANQARRDRRTSDDPYDIDVRSAPRTPEVLRDLEDRAMRALEIERDLLDEHKDAVDGLLRNRKINRGGALARHVIMTGRPAYRSAFAKLMRMDGAAFLTPEEADAVEEVRAMNITTDADGGFLMPFTLDPSIVLVNDGRVNPMRRLATVRSVVTDNWQGVNTVGVTASWDTESEEVSDDTPTLTQPSITVKGIKAFVPFTVEAEDDFAGLASDVSTLILDAVDEQEATGFATGSGAGNFPQGIVTGLIATAIQTAGIGTYVLADFDSLSDGIPDRYDARASVMMHRNIVTATRNLGDTAGDPATYLSSDGPVIIRGRNVHKYSALDSSVATGNEIAVAGDIAACYRIHDRLGTTVERVQHLFGANRRPTGERGWFARKRVGAGVVNANAARVLQVQ
jgi:HK97 family phage major capsid protein